MDGLDLRILRDVGLEPFAGSTSSPHPWRPEELAARVKESPRLVKDRIARLEREGVIRRFELQPNLAHLGLAARTYAFPYEARAGRADAIAQLERVEGVFAIVDYLTGWLTVTFAYASEDERTHRLARMSEALGGLEPETWFEGETPPCRRELTRLDWRILRGLRGDARVSVGELAERVGVTPKTVQRHLDRLSEERAFSVFALLDERSMDELLMCSLVLRVDMERAREAMVELHARLLAEAWAHCSAPLFQEGIHYDLVAAPRTPRGLAELLEETARIPGVLEVRGHLATGVTWCPAWLDAQMDARIAALPA